MFLEKCFLVLLTVYWNWLAWVQVKRPSHGKLKLAKSCWLTQVDVCERHKNSRQTRFSVFDANSLQTCLPPVFVPFTHTNLGLPTRVCQVKFAVWRPLKKASDSVQRPPTDCRETNWSNFAANGILNQINALLRASSQMLEKTIHDTRRGSRGGEMGEFSPPFFWAPFFLFFSYPSNIDWFQYIITKIHPPFQNPGSARGETS